MKQKRRAVPLPILVLVLAFLCPTELSLDLAGLRLPPHRFALLVLLPMALTRLMSGRNIRLHTFDFLILTFGTWITWVYTYHHGQPGFIYGGSVMLESVGGYLVARAYIRDAETYRASIRVLFIAILVAAGLALLDTFIGDYVTHRVLRLVFGGDPLPPVQYRAGLARAASVFDHPIHYGTFCATLMAVFWFSEKRFEKRLTQAGAVSFATLLGMSSAPLLCIALQSGMIVWERVTRGIAMRTAMTLAIVAGLFLGAGMVSDRGPIQLIATSLTFDSWTGYYRTQIWTFGVDNVIQSPWMGIGLNDWARPGWMASPTIDAFWLVITLQCGIPALILLASAVIVLARAVNRKAIWGRDAEIRTMARGWMISLIALCLVGVTVHYWNVMQAYFFFFIGLAGWMADPKRRTVAKKAPAADPQPELPDPFAPEYHPGYGRPAYS